MPLHSDHYCHFTSPIRRYPDLAIHRMIEAIIAGKRPPDAIDQLVLLGEHCSQREQRAEQAERELTKVKLLSLLSKNIGKQLDAVITGVERFGLFAQGIKLPAEGLIHVNSLLDDYYQYDQRTHSLTGRREGNSFRLGDLIRVEVAHVDVERRELDFRIVARRPRPAASKSDRRSRGSERLGRRRTAQTRKTPPLMQREVAICAAHRGGCAMPTPILKLTRQSRVHAVSVNMDRLKRTATFWESSVVEKGTDPFCRNGPQGAAHKRGLSPFLSVRYFDSVAVFLR